MNVDTGQLGTLDELLKAAKPGERVIPATIIPAPAQEARPAPATYGPRKPLREVRAELKAARDQGG
jgi:hypothetical protein